VVIGIIALLISILLPSLNRARETANRVKCASNLRQIGLSIMQYSNDSKGPFPRTLYNGAAPNIYIAHPFGLGNIVSNLMSSGLTDPFSPGTPPNVAIAQGYMNNVPECLFLLLRTQDITAAVFNCPSANTTPDSYGGGTNTALNQINFTNIQQNLSYSYANPFPDSYAAGAGFKMVQGMEPTFALCADINPGTTGGGGNDNVLAVTSNSSPSQMALGNSNNHNKQGQEVLYADFHVDWQTNPFCGVNQDNIYTAGGTLFYNSGIPTLVNSPYTINDSIMLPTDDDF
jgi:type II secretory pathway pseudopilin PulG